MQQWLLGGLAKTGLKLPTQLDVPGVVELLLSVFGLNKDAVLAKLHERLVNVVGPENAQHIETLLTKVGGVALTLFKQGPAAAWKEIVAEAKHLRAQALDFVRDGVLDVAKKGIAKFVAGLVVPGGGFLLAAKGIYDTIMTFIEKGKQIAAVGRAFFESVQKIAAGDLTTAAQKVEDTLVRILPVVLAFVAKLLNLDGLTAQIQAGLQKVQAPVNRAVDAVLDKVEKLARPVWDKPPFVPLPT